MKLKHDMYNGLRIYQTKYCKTTFLVLAPLSYIIFNRPVVDKRTLLRQKSQRTHYYYYRIAIKLAKAYKYCCSFNKISIKRKNYVSRKV